MPAQGDVRDERSTGSDAATAGGGVRARADAAHVPCDAVDSDWGDKEGPVAHVLEQRVFPQLDFQEVMAASAVCRSWAAISAPLRADWKEELVGEHLSAFSPD